MTARDAGKGGCVSSEARELDPGRAELQRVPTGGTTDVLPAGPVTVATGAVVCGMLPLYLVSAQAVQIREYFGFGPTTLGFLASMYLAARALASLPLGRFADRVGARVAVRTAMFGTAMAAVAIALFANGSRSLMALLVAAGTAQALGASSVNLFLSRTIPARRMGLAFGIKQSGPPAATMLAGLAVPVFALAIGWRASFVVAAVLALGVAAMVPPVAPAPPKSAAHRAGALPPRLLSLLALTLTFSIGASTSLTTFLVDFGVHSGLTPGMAAVLLTGAGIAAILARIAMGVVADRTPRDRLSVISIMLAIGACGYVLMSTAHTPLLVAGSLVAAGVGWGVTGLFFLAIVQLNPSAPATATGAVVAGGSIGGVVAPTIFGFVAENQQYATAWLFPAGLMLMAAVCMWLARLRIRLLPVEP